jgi:hypothetical protein
LKRYKLHELFFCPPWIVFCIFKEFYQYVNFARQYYRRDVITRVLNNTIVARPFTVYQLADIVVNQLPNVIQQYEAKMAVVSDLPDMFVHDP